MGFLILLLSRRPPAAAAFIETPATIRSLGAEYGSTGMVTPTR